ncbi:MAG: hypothetical protein AAGG44_13855 [Planctomycetota bacterium]
MILLRADSSNAKLSSLGIEYMQFDRTAVNQSALVVAMANTILP